MRRIATFAAAAALGSSTNASRRLLAVTAIAAGPDTTTSGTKVAEDRKKVGFAACCQMRDGTSPGSIDRLPVPIKARSPGRARLYEQTWDARKVNPATRMPPAGKHGAFSNTNADTVVGALPPLISAGPCPA